jgi:predicted ATPase
MKCRAFGARTLWYVGYPNQAVQQSQEARTMADALAHPYYVSDTLLESAHLYACRREWQSVHAHAEAALALATAYGFARLAAQGTLCRGRALAAQGQHREGLTQMQQGLAAHRATGTVIGLPFWLAQLAEAYGQAGQVEAGMPLLVEAVAVVDKTGVRASAAELHRLRGVLLLQQPVPETQAAAACFQQALTVARRQQAKSWELRAATSLARLWQQQGKRAAAYALLAPIYGWFTEGFDTADLQEAKALLEELGG